MIALICLIRIQSFSYWYVWNVFQWLETSGFKHIVLSSPSDLSRALQSYRINHLRFNHTKLNKVKHKIPIIFYLIQLSIDIWSGQNHCSTFSNPITTCESIVPTKNTLFHFLDKICFYDVDIHPFTFHICLDNCFRQDSKDLFWYSPYLHIFAFKQLSNLCCIYMHSKREW